MRFQSTRDRVLNIGDRWQSVGGIGSIMATKGPWWNPNLDAEIKAICVYGPIPSRPLKWWERVLGWIGLGRFVHRETRLLTAEEVCAIAAAMAAL